MDLKKIKDKVKQDSGMIGQHLALKAAILIPLIEVDKEWHILFEARSLKLNHQPGDICFPGGQIDETDATPENAALRETKEELGIPIKDIKMIGELATYIPSPQMMIYPFVGVINHESILDLNHYEVESVFTVPLQWLIDHQPEEHIVDFDVKPRPDFPFDRIYGGEKYPFRNRQMIETFYSYHDRTIWGLTARILQHFLSVIK